MSSAFQPKTIEKLGSAAYPAFAMVAAMQLDLFTPLSKGPMSAKQLADAMDVKPEKLTQLLYVLVTAGLLIVKDEQFANTPEADYFLVKNKSTYLGGRHAFYSARYNEITQTASSIRSGRPQAKLDFASMSTEELEAYLRGLHPATMAAGRDLLNRADFSSYRRLLDVGGGSGGLAIAIAAACPKLYATVVELPSVAPVTQRFIELEGMTERAEVIIGDLVRSPLRGTYDVAVLRAFIQVLSQDQARHAFCNLIHALEPGGKIYLLGQVLDDSRISPPESVAFNLVFINVYDEGQAYTEHEYLSWLTEAGFTDIERTILAGGQSLITANKPTKRLS
ncbi:MAG: methyltransferase [Desulfobulbus sp.]|nr:methyltransferase [Desulfobulbus sp.]